MADITINTNQLFTTGDELLYNIQSILSGISLSNTMQISNGLNTYTGGTTSNPSINISGGTVNNWSATTLSGGTIYSGSTELSTLFGSATNVTTLQNQMLTKANLSGATFT